MNKDEFYNYILENFSLDGTARRLIQNILDYIEKTAPDENEQYQIACDLLAGFGMTDAEMRKIAF